MSEMPAAKMAILVECCIDWCPHYGNAFLIELRTWGNAVEWPELRCSGCSGSMLRSLPTAQPPAQTLDSLREC